MKTLDKTTPVYFPVLVVLLGLSFFFQVQPEFLGHPQPLFLTHGILALGALIVQLFFRSKFKRYESWSLILFAWLFLLLFYRVIVTAIRVRTGFSEEQLFPVLLGLTFVICVIIWWSDIGPKLTRLLNIFLSVFLVISMYNNFSTWNQARSGIAKFVEEEAPLKNVFDESSPDIYFIVLDGYLRQDRLTAQIGYDNSAFINSLKERGYIVGDNTLSNFSQTLLSLSSVLNMSLMENVTSEFSEESKNRLVFRELFAQNKLMRMLEEGGYRTRVFSSGFEHTSLRDASFYVDDFESFFSQPAPALLFGYTFLPDLLDYFGEDYRYKAETRRISKIIKQTQVPPESRTPRFTFSHIMSPHYPLTFTEAGEHLENDRPYRNAFDPSLLGDNYISQFIDEMEYLNGEVIELLDRIRYNGRESIVLLISDHGTNLKVVDGPDHYRNLMGALRAVSVPDHCKDLVVLNQSLANTFQSVLNPCFGLDLEMVQPKYRSSTWSKPFKFIDVEEYLH